MKHVLSVLCLVVLAGCTTTNEGSKVPEEPETPVIQLCENGEYHKAMQALPEAMEDWATYTEQTGRTSEGAAGYEYHRAMMAIAHKGDDDWGKILDDPKIPYRYKTEMLFEIARARLGKGASWSPTHTEVVIIPRSKPARSWKEVNVLLQNVLNEQTDAPDQK